MEHKFDLKNAIRNAQIDIDEVSKACNLTYNDISAMMRGEKDIPDDVVGKLYRLYGESIFF